MSNIQEAIRKAIADEEEGRPGSKVDVKFYWYERNGVLIIPMEISRTSYLQRE